MAGAAAVLCAGLVPVLLFAPPSRRAVVFEPEGLRFVEPSYDVRVTWDQIVDARILDIKDTLVVALTLRDPAEFVPSRAPGTGTRQLRCDASRGPCR